MSHPNSLALAILMFFCLVVTVDTRASLEEDKYEFVNKYTDRQDLKKQERAKRAGFVPVMSGYRVWKSILRNSHRVKVTGSDDAYEAFHYTREGGYLRAVEDFYSMKPDDVRYFYKDNHAFGNVGTIGERTVVLQGKVLKGVPSKPTLRVFKTNRDGSDDAEQIITYMNSQ